MLEPPAGLEPATLGLEVPRAIQLRQGGQLGNVATYTRCMFFFK